MPREPQDALGPRGDVAGAPAARTVGGRYRLEQVLGRGGMGVVWAGQDEVLHRPVAIKEVLPPATVDDADRAEMRARTLREAQAAARISADGVVHIYDVVEDDGRPWIVMERLPPRTLEDELSERGGIPPAEVAQIGRTLLAGLIAAHAAGVLHRDVKPSNVMFRERPDGRHAVLADFGIAHLDGDAMLTATGMMMGSPAYIAPERARGDEATPAADLWSLGVTLWAAVEGWSPFRRVNGLASLTAVITEDVPAPDHAGPLGPVLEGLLRKDPAERIDAATAGRLLAEIPPPVGARTERLGVATTQPLPAPATSTSTSTRTRTTTATGSPPPTVPPATARPDEDAVDEDPAWWAPAPPAPEPRPARRRRGGILPAVVALAVVAVLALGAALLRPFDDDGDTPEARPEASAPATAPPAAPETPAAPEPDPAPEPEPEPEPAPEAPAAPAAPPEEGTDDPAAGGDAAAAVPEGFERYDDPTGFSVAVPAGWEAERDGPRVYLRDPASSAYLLVDQTDDPAADPVADWQQQEPAVADRLDNYERIGQIEATDYRGWEAADWEFVFGPGQGTHVLNRNVVTSPDQAYALYWSVPSSRWESMLPVHEQVVASFQPAG